MASRVVVTYKRKRLFSRSDRSPLNLHSDTPSKISKLNTSADLHNHEGPVEESTLPNKVRKFGISHEYSKDNAKKDVQQCANFDSNHCTQCAEKHDMKLKMLFSVCTNKKESSVSNGTQNVTPKKIRRSNSFHPNVLLEGSPGETCQIGSADQSNAEEKSAGTQLKLLFPRSGSEYDNKCKETLSISPLPDAYSAKEPGLVCLQTSDETNCSWPIKGAFNSGAFTLKETDKLNKDQCSSPCNILGTKCKLTSTLITFSRRSKPNRDIATPDIASGSETPAAANCSVDLKNKKIKLMNSIIGSEQKRPAEDIDNSCSLSARAPDIAVVMHMDELLHLPPGEAENAPTAAAQPVEDSYEEMSSSQGKFSMDVQDNHHTNVRPQSLSPEDVNGTRMPSDVAGKRDSLPSLDLSIPPHASRDIDCNRSPDCGPDENNPLEPLEALHDSLASTSKAKENLPTLQVENIENDRPVRARRDKGKSIVDPPPVGNSSKNNYIQLFPEKRSNGMLRLANDLEKTNQLQPATLLSSNVHGLSLQLEQMIDGRACSSSMYGWLNVQVQPRESFHDFLHSTSDRTPSFSRHMMMLDNISTRAKAVRGIRSKFFDNFNYPTTWSEEELDCLWIGVRRHGRGKWDAILTDRRLHFSPWKMPQDLAERWQEEESQLFSNLPVSQVNYGSPPDFSSNPVTSLQPADEVQLSLGDAHKRQSHYFRKNPQLQKLITNSGASSSHSYMTNNCWDLYNQSIGNTIPGYESSYHGGPTNGTLPHWLRAVVEVPSRLSDPTQTVVPSFCHCGVGWHNQPTFECLGSSHQPWLNNKCISTQRTEPHNGGKASCSNSVIWHRKTQPSEHPGNNQDDLIIIPSDASSEETISDDHGIRP